jgi:crotonobetainyl-CoA:carnitine CoA-transferase CaiB-like acyl-CoA transferase
VREIVADPHFKARDMVVEVPHPGLDRNVAIAGVPVKMNKTPGKVARRAPLLGEDTDAILGELGFASSDIRRWREDKIIV